MPSHAYKSRTILTLLKQRVTKELIHHLAEITMGVVDMALERERTSSEQNCVKAFKVFSCDVVKYLKVSIKVFSVAALYIKRAEPHLAFDDDEKDKAPERVFLGAMMLASKYVGDTTYHAGFWEGANRFIKDLKPVKVEFEFLHVLGWELGFTYEAFDGPTSRVLEVIRDNEKRHSILCQPKEDSEEDSNPPIQSNHIEFQSSHANMMRQKPLQPNQLDQARQRQPLQPSQFDQARQRPPHRPSYRPVQIYHPQPMGPAHWHQGSNYPQMRFDPYQQGQANPMPQEHLHRMRSFGHLNDRHPPPPHAFQPPGGGPAWMPPPHGLCAGPNL